MDLTPARVLSDEGGFHKERSWRCCAKARLDRIFVHPHFPACRADESRITSVAVPRIRIRPIGLPLYPNLWLTLNANRAQLKREKHDKAAMMYLRITFGFVTTRQST